MSKEPYPRVRYTGELAKPIRLRDHENTQAAAEVIENNLKALATRHGVNAESTNVVLDLALALMQAHVPGLRITNERGRGRERTWLNGLGEALRIDINAAKERFGCMVSEAITHLRADKNKSWSKYRPQTLAARYRDASRRYRSASQRDRIVLVLMARDATANRD